MELPRFCAVGRTGWNETMKNDSQAWWLTIHGFYWRTLSKAVAADELSVQLNMVMVWAYMLNLAQATPTWKLHLPTALLLQLEQLVY